VDSVKGSVLCPHKMPANEMHSEAEEANAAAFEKQLKFLSACRSQLS